MNCKSPDNIVDPTNSLLLIAQAPFTMRDKSLKRLKAASKLMRHYTDVSIEPTARNIRWCVTEVYEQARKALKDLAKAPTPSIPKLTKNTRVRHHQLGTALPHGHTSLVPVNATYVCSHYFHRSDFQPNMVLSIFLPCLHTGRHGPNPMLFPGHQPC